MEGLTKEQLRIERNKLKSRIDLRRLFIREETKLAKQLIRSIQENKKELKQFERDYLQLIDQI